MDMSTPLWAKRGPKSRIRLRDYHERIVAMALVMGDQQIAKDLGCARCSVTDYRQLNDIPGKFDKPRRGDTWDYEHRLAINAVSDEIFKKRIGPRRFA